MRTWAILIEMLLKNVKARSLSSTVNAPKTRQEKSTSNCSAVRINEELGRTLSKKSRRSFICKKKRERDNVTPSPINWNHLPEQNDYSSLERPRESSQVDLHLIWGPRRVLISCIEQDPQERGWADLSCFPGSRSLRTWNPFLCRVSRGRNLARDPKSGKK